MTLFTLLGAALCAMAVALLPHGRRPRMPGRAGPRSTIERPAVLRFRMLLHRSAVPVEFERVPVLWAAAIGFGAIAGFALAGIFGLVGGAIVAIAGPPAWIAGRGDRRRALVIASLPDLLELVARGLRGGSDLSRALRDAATAVGGAGVALGETLERVDAGARLGDALDHWAVALDHPDAAIVRSVVRLGDSTGAALGAALDRAAATLRERAALRDEIHALTAQTRASSMVVALAPLGFLAVVTSTDPRSSEVLFATSWGRLCLVAGLALDAAGILWMRHLTNGVDR